MPIQTDTLDTLIAGIFLEDCRQLMAGLTILSKDLSEFLAVNAYVGSDAKRFSDIYADTLNEDRFYWSRYGNELYEPLHSNNLPHGFAQSAIGGQFDLSPIQDEAIDQEWTRQPGWALLKNFKTAFHENLCNVSGVIQKHFDAGEADNKALALKIAEEILKSELSERLYWYPLVAVLAVLIAKTDVKSYCEELEVVSS